VKKYLKEKAKAPDEFFIKHVGMDGVTSMYAWTAQLKGMGQS